MKIIDYLFYRIFAMGHFSFKKNIEDSKFSAVLLTATVLTFLIGFLIEVSGLFYANSLSNYYVFRDNGMLYTELFVGAIISVVLYIRYFKTDAFNKLTIKFGRIKCLERILLVLFIVAILFFNFVLFRYLNNGIEHIWYN